MQECKFEKVSYEQYLKAAIKCNGWGKFTMKELTDAGYLDLIKSSYDSIKLPKRATKTSAGYDFYAPYEFMMKDRGTVVPTGIRWKGHDNQVLLILPRSGLGFKYRVRLMNTEGVIDSDYYYSDNEGHIMLGFDKPSTPININAGDAIVQGIITTYCITDDDNTDTVRNGGFGSTDK